MTDTSAPTVPAPNRIDPAVLRTALTVIVGALAVVFDTTIVSVAINTIGSPSPSQSPGGLSRRSAGNVCGSSHSASSLPVRYSAPPPGTPRRSSAPASCRASAAAS
jgi:hypothetical protein